MAQPKTYLNSEQAAEYLGISAATLKNWRKRGDGPPFIKVNARVIRYLRCDLDVWMDTKPKQTISGDEF